MRADVISPKQSEIKRFDRVQVRELGGSFVMPEYKWRYRIGTLCHARAGNKLGRSVRPKIKCSRPFESYLHDPVF